jgi:ParB family chromosome partitioning protein
LAELAASISEHGLIQPLIVHDEGEGQYTLIAGERRWRAAQQADLGSVPVVVKEASPQTMLEMALIENIQRADLNPLEEASAYQQLVEGFGLTQAQVAQRVGKSRPTVANMIRLLDLPAEVQEAVVNGALSGGHARTLLSLPEADKQVMLMETILAEGLNVRQTEQMVRLHDRLPGEGQEALLAGEIEIEHAELILRLPNTGQQIAMVRTILNKGLSVAETEASVEKQLSRKRPRPKQTSRPTPELVWLESQFQQSLGTRVNIQKGSKGGKVVIHFFSDEELQAIYDSIVGE